MPTFSIANVREDPWLVEDGPGVDSIAQCFDNDLDIINEAGSGVTVGPSAIVFERLWEVLVKERDKRPHACSKDRIGETFIVVDALLIYGS